jgi:hypothetical protein
MISPVGWVAISLTALNLGFCPLFVAVQHEGEYKPPGTLCKGFLLLCSILEAAL